MDLEADEVEAELRQQPKKIKKCYATRRGRLSKGCACNLSGIKMVPQNPQGKILVSGSYLVVQCYFLK